MLPADLHIFQPNKSYRIEWRQVHGGWITVTLNFDRAYKWGEWWFIRGTDMVSGDERSWVIDSIGEVEEIP